MLLLLGTNHPDEICPSFRRHVEKRRRHVLFAHGFLLFSFEPLPSSHERTQSPHVHQPFASLRPAD